MKLGVAALLLTAALAGCGGGKASWCFDGGTGWAGTGDHGASCPPEPIAAPDAAPRAEGAQP